MSKWKAFITSELPWIYSFKLFNFSYFLFFLIRPKLSAFIGVFSSAVRSSKNIFIFSLKLPFKFFHVSEPGSPSQIKETLVFIFNSWLAFGEYKLTMYHFSRRASFARKRNPLTASGKRSRLRNPNHLAKFISCYDYNAIRFSAFPRNGFKTFFLDLNN